MIRRQGSPYQSAPDRPLAYLDGVPAAPAVRQTESYAMPAYQKPAERRFIENSQSRRKVGNDSPVSKQYQSNYRQRQPEEEEDNRSFCAKYWWIFAIIVGVILITLLVLLLTGAFKRADHSTIGNLVAAEQKDEAVKLEEGKEVDNESNDPVLKELEEVDQDDLKQVDRVISQIEASESHQMAVTHVSPLPGGIHELGGTLQA